VPKAQQQQTDASQTEDIDHLHQKQEEGQTLPSSVPTGFNRKSHQARKRMVDQVEAAEIALILERCGFNDDLQGTSIAADGFELCTNITTEKDIGNLAKCFSGRTAADGRINCRLRRSNHLKATTHWAQTFRPISRATTLAGINKAAKFRTRIETARQRTQVRKHKSTGRVQTKKTAQARLLILRTQVTTGMDRMVQSPEVLHVDHFGSGWSPSELCHPQDCCTKL
jgi:hypothetical protein